MEAEGEDLEHAAEVFEKVEVAFNWIIVVVQSIAVLVSVYVITVQLKE